MQLFTEVVCELGDGRVLVEHCSSLTLLRETGDWSPSGEGGVAKLLQRCVVRYNTLSILYTSD